MKKFLLSSTTAFLLTTAAAFAQASPRQPTPNDTLKSPQVLPGNRVAIQIYAPKADEVTMSGDFLGPAPA